MWWCLGRETKENIKGDRGSRGSVRIGPSERLAFASLLALSWLIMELCTIMNMLFHDLQSDIVTSFFGCGRRSRT